MQKIINILAILLLLQQLAAAQSPYQKLIDKGNYEKAFKKANKAVNRDSRNVEANYNLAQLYYLYCKNNSLDLSYNKLKLNIDKSYQIINKTKKLQNKNGVNKINNSQIEQLNQDICNLAFELAESKNTNKAYYAFIRKHKSCPTIIAKARNKIIDNALSKAKEKNTTEALLDFIVSFPNTNQAELALQIKDSLVLYIQKQKLLAKQKALSVNQKWIKNAIDTTVVNTFMSLASFIEPQWVERDTFNKLNGNIIYKIDNSDDVFANKYAYDLFLPIDIKYVELPVIIRKLDSLLYGGALPPQAEYYSLNNDLNDLLIRINQYEQKGYSFPLIKKQIRQLQEQYWINAPLGAPTNWISESLIIKEFQYGTEKDSISNFLKMMIIERFRMAFYNSVIEHGIKIAGDIPEIQNALKTKDLEVQLSIARKENKIKQIAIIEKQLVNQLMKVLNDYYDEDEDISIPGIKQSPRYFLKGKETPSCVGYVMISKCYLDKWDIKIQAVFRYGHIFSNVILSDNKNYIMDIMARSFLVKAEFIKSTGNWSIIQIEEDTIPCLYKEVRQGIVGAYFLNMRKLIDEEDYMLASLKEGVIEVPFSNWWYNIAFVQNKLKKYKLADIAINNSLLNYPNDMISWSLKSDIALYNNDYDGYIKADAKYDELSKP